MKESLRSEIEPAARQCLIAHNTPETRRVEANVQYFDLFLEQITLSMELAGARSVSGAAVLFAQKGSGLAKFSSDAGTVTQSMATGFQTVLANSALTGLSSVTPGRAVAVIGVVGITKLGLMSGLAATDAEAACFAAWTQLAASAGTTALACTAAGPVTAGVLCVLSGAALISDSYKTYAACSGRQVNQVGDNSSPQQSLGRH